MEEVLDKYQEKNYNLVVNDANKQYAIGQMIATGVPVYNEIVVSELLDKLDIEETIGKYFVGGLTAYMIYNKMKGLYRTTTNNIFNNSELSGAIASGYSHKKWSAILDERTRDLHEELDATILPINEDFEIAGYSAPCPGEFGEPEMDCNCRCSLEYLMLDYEDVD